jgi:RimJ/RimL family protein N-acetyltransferase
MITELGRADVHRVASLFEAYTYDLARLESYLADDRTRAFADDCSAPTVAMLVPAVDISFLAGCPDPSRIRPLVEHVAAVPGLSDPLVFSVPTPQWDSVINTEFGNAVSPNPTISFTFANPQGLAIRDWRQRVPAGCEIRRMDHDLADRAQEVAPEFPGLWPDPGVFLQRGIGFCLLQNNRILSIAYSMLAPGKLLEVAVATARDMRGRGYSPLTAAPLIEHCLDINVEPVWSCFGWNHASQSVARKLGFASPVHHTWFTWTPFNAGRGTVILPATTLRDYAGHYRRNNCPAEIRVGGDGLLYIDEHSQELSLAAEALDRFFFRHFDFQVEFTRCPDGRVDTLIRHQSGRQLRWERV